VSIPVLLYHGVGMRVDPRFARWVVTPTSFAEQMATLAAEGYSTITATQAAEALRSHRPAGERVVAITFDDGFAEVHDSAWPVLRRHGLTATVYVATGYVGDTSRWLHDEGEGTRPMLDWDQIAELADGGIEIGAHTESHVALDTVSRARAAREIERSRDALAAVVGPVASFAYPYGYHRASVRRQVREAGFTHAYTVGDGIASAADDRFAITRAIVARETTTERFAEILAARSGRVGRRPVRRAAWRAVRRAGGQPLVDRVRGAAAARPVG